MIVSKNNDVLCPSTLVLSSEANEDVDLEQLEVPKVVKKWMTDEEWKRILEVSKLNDFASLPLSIKKMAPAYSTMWQNIFRSGDPVNENFRLLGINWKLTESLLMRAIF